MNRILFSLLFITILFSSRNLIAQEENFNFCQRTAPWEDFIIDSTIEKNKSNILIVSNRPYIPEQKEFLPNEIADWRKVSYFLAYCESNKWHLTYIDNIITGLNTINSGTSDLLLFVHGHGKSFPLVMSRGGQILARYDVKLILFDWPSENSNFHKSMARVRRCGENFYNLLLQLKSYRADQMNSDQHLSIMAHSLGNYFLTHLVVNGNNQYMNEKFIDNIILTAPAVKSNEQGDVLSQLNFQNQVYVALNENDRVLRGAHLITYGKMLGNFVVPPLATNTEYVHFTSIANKQHTYFAGYYQFEYENPAVYNFFNTVIHGRQVDFDRNNFYKLRSTLNDGYDIVP